ncbi:MAG: glycosyltransferase family 2 protein [Gemmatimonadales bacterium]
MSAPVLRLSVAVCTRRRPEQLRRALASLAGQQVPPHEVLVVDNDAGSDDVARMVEEEFPGMRWVREPVPGLDFARNRALRECTGDVVAFLDDDAVADPGWAGAIRETFADPAVAACTGRVKPLMLDTEAQRLFEANGGFGRGTVTIRLPEDRRNTLHGWPAPLIAWAVSVGSGCSLAVRRDAALQLGGFDEALDLGPALPGGGDHDMLWRFLEAGHRIVYNPAVCAQHEHRREVDAAMDQIVGHQRALIAWLTKHLVGGGHRPSIAAFLGWRLLKPGVRLARRVAGLDPLPAAVLFRMWIGCWRGLGAYPVALRIAARRRAEAA